MARNPRFSTPLHMAAGTASQAVAQALLEMSVDVNAKNKYSKTPYDVRGDQQQDDVDADSTGRRPSIR